MIVHIELNGDERRALNEMVSCFGYVPNILPKLAAIVLAASRPLVREGAITATAAAVDMPEDWEGHRRRVRRKDE